MGTTSTRPPRERIASLLGDLTGAGPFSTRRTAPTDDLRLEVRGIGPVRLPVSAAQARRLCKVARPARYGHGELTLLNREVRDTWEIPRSRIRIDKRRWNQTLRPMLDRLGVDLGLAAGARLDAELHSMLVYGPGQPLSEERAVLRRLLRRLQARDPAGQVRAPDRAHVQPAAAR